MKAIFIYSGLPRFVKQNLSSIEYVSKSMPGSVSIFSFWESNPETDEAIKVLNKNVTPAFFFKIKPSEKTLNFFSLNGEQKLPSMIVNSLLQFDAISQAYDNALSVVDENEKDLIWVRSRTDLLIKRKLDLKVVENDVVYLPGVKFGIGFTDYFGWGSKKSIESYTKTYNMMLNLFSQDIFLPPEVCLGLTLQKTKTKVIVDRNLPTGLVQLKNDRLILRSSYQNERSTRYRRYWNCPYYGNGDGSQETFLNEIRNRTIGFSQDLIMKIKVRSGL